MYTPGHRNTMSTPNLDSVVYQHGARPTSSIPPPAPLDLPEPTSPRSIPQSNVSRSPLRNSITMDPVTGTMSQDGSPQPIDRHDPWGTRDDQTSPSPAPSITKFASSFSQRVGSLLSSVSPSSQTTPLPTDAEIEAEAASQRKQSRLEAERILTREAVERKKVEERVMEMLEAARTRPSRSQTVPLPDSPSPSPSKEGGGPNWWIAAKNRLTKEKELTPAQQVIAETKAKEKEKRKSREYKDWPANGTSSYPDHFSQPSLPLPPGARPPGGFVGSGANVIPSASVEVSSVPQPQPGRSSSPRTPSPSRNTPVYHKNGPAADLSNASPGAFSTASSSKDGTPIYAQFTGQGSLDVPATLLTIARRFEKLERWTVGHVRALEDRMNDVEQWLVDKEREKERDAKKAGIEGAPSVAVPSQPTKVVREVTIERVELDESVKQDVNDMKDELGELRSRVGELGREMARFATVAANTSRPDTPSEVGFGIGRLGSPGIIGSDSSLPVRVSNPRNVPAIPAQRDRTQSPSAHSIVQSETASIISTTSTMARTKLPYPTGDYTSPSPPSSPPPRHVTPTPTGSNPGSGFSRTRPISYSNRPASPSQSPMIGLDRSPAQSGFESPSSSPVVGTPTKHVGVSPNPRKRYTVALGQPISSSPSMSNRAETPEVERILDDNLFSDPPKVELQTAFFTEVKATTPSTKNEKDVGDGDITFNDGRANLHRQDTIGKTPVNLSNLSTSPPSSQTSSPSRNVGLQRSSRVSPESRRIRTQSTYGVPGSSPFSVQNGPKVGAAAVNAHTPISARHDQNDVDPKGSWRSRSRSIDRFGGLASDSGSKFVDPLIIRKKEKAAVGSRNSVIGTPVPGGRKAFGDLLAFFDAEKQPRSPRSP